MIKQDILQLLLTARYHAVQCLYIVVLTFLLYVFPLKNFLPVKTPNARLQNGYPQTNGWPPDDELNFLYTVYDWNRLTDLYLISIAFSHHWIIYILTPPWRWIALYIAIFIGYYIECQRLYLMESESESMKHVDSHNGEAKEEDKWRHPVWESKQQS